MGKLYKPGVDEIEHFNQLALGVFRQRVGGISEIELSERGMYVNYTKSKIFAANVRYDSEKTVTGIPSPVVVKHYGGLNLPRTSGKDNDWREFMREVIVLGLDVNSITPFTGEEPVRVYPQVYSAQNEPCLRDMTLFREFIPGKTLENIAVEKANSLTWEAKLGEPDVRKFLMTLAVLHLRTNAARISESLYRAAPKEFIPCTLDRVIPERITQTRKRRVLSYLQTLVEGKGMVLEREGELSRGLSKAFYCLDSELVSRPELITVVDGELDVFPHHAMVDRIPDAGGVEFGGIARDLAVYGAPCFEKLWVKNGFTGFAFNLAEDYLSVRSAIEAHVGDGKTINQIVDGDTETFAQGIMLAMAMGNLRKAAAVVHYRANNGQEEDPTIEPEVTAHLRTSRVWLDALRSGLKGRLSEGIERFMRISDAYSLGTEDYKLARGQSHLGAENRSVQMSA